MATQTVNLPYDTSTVANYKAISSQFGTALAAFGWIQTADSGQVTWASVSTLPGNNTFRDYEVWRMADTAQTTTPVYIKLEYSTQGTNAPLQRLTIGSGSNGSGTITGTTLLSATNISVGNTTSQGAANNYACYYSGGTGRVMFLMYEGIAGTTASVPYLVSIERSKDTSGNDTTDFVSVTLFNAPSTGITHKTMIGSVVSSSESRTFGFYSSTSTNNLNGTTAASPQFCLVGKVSNPLLGLGYVPVADVGEGATVTVNIYGATHTYICCKANNGSGFGNPVGLGNNTGATLCRYE